MEDGLYQDVYYNGDWTLALKNGATAEIAYNGMGTSAVANGPYKATLSGITFDFSGRQWTRTIPFFARLTGNDETNGVRLRFRLGG